MRVDPPAVRGLATSMAAICSCYIGYIAVRVAPLINVPEYHKQFQDKYESIYPHEHSLKALYNI